MSSMSVVKSPTSGAVVPTFVLAPAVLMRTWSRSGNGFAVVVLVQKVMVTPFCSVTAGVSSQLLMVLVPVVLLKLAPIYEVGSAPMCAGKTASLPWNHPVVPIVVLWLVCTQPAAGSVVMSSKPWVNPGVQVGDADGEAVTDGVGVGVPGLTVAEGVGVAPPLGQLSLWTSVTPTKGLPPIE